MLWAAATTTFFTFCQPGEIVVSKGKTHDPHTNLSYEDISVDNSQNPSIVSLLIKRSKTNQAREGVKLYMGRYMACEGTASFSEITRLKVGTLFIWQDGTPLLKPHFNKVVKLALTQAQLPAEKFAGHSFCIGAAATAALLA